DLKQRSKSLVVTRPSRRPKAVRAAAASDSGWRRRAPHLFRDDQTGPLDVLAMRNDAQLYRRTRRRSPEHLINLGDRRDAPPVNAPHGIAFAQRRRAAQRTVAAQFFDDNAAADE